MADGDLTNRTFGNISTAASDRNTEATAYVDSSLQLALAIEFYFQYIIIAIGVFGTVANTLVLYALIKHHLAETKKRAINLMIINQNVIDLTCSVLLVITFIVRVMLNHIYLTGTLGFVVCAVVITENAVYCGLNASVFNLIALTVERYLKIVFLVWSKTYLKQWMVRVAMVFVWIAGAVSIMPVAFVTSVVEDGICWPYCVWQPGVKLIFELFRFVAFFLFPLIIFVYCYGHIAITLKRQAKVMAGHGHQSQLRSQQAKWNIVKTMIFVSLSFSVCWFPFNIYFVIMDYSAQARSDLFIGYYPTVFLVYLNICMNPFIYALKHDGVKRNLRSMMTTVFSRSSVGESSVT